MKYVRVDNGDDVLFLTRQEIESFSSRLDVQGFIAVEMQDETSLYLSELEYENALKRASKNRSVTQSAYLAKEQTSLDLQHWNKTIMLVGALLAMGVMLVFIRGPGITGMVAAEPVEQGAGLFFAAGAALGLIVLIFMNLKKKML